MKKTTIIVVILGIIIFASFFQFRGNHSLKDFQDWLNNTGLATIFSILIPTWIYLIVYLWNKRKEETPEYKKHEELLLSTIHKIEDVQAVGYRELSLINRWENMYDELTFRGWEVKYSGNSVIIESLLENSDIWTFLESHLNNSKLQALLSEWKLAMEQDLIARQSLYDSIANKVRESTKIPVIEYAYGKEYLKPYITDYYAAVIYDAVFCALSGNPIQDTKSYLSNNATDVSEQGNISWRYGGNNWLILSIDDVKQRDDAINLLLKLESDLIDLPAAQKAKYLYFEGISKTKQLSTMIKITTNLPHGKRCDYCKKL